jgi:ornithine carbamoyltransferase
MKLKTSHLLTGEELSNREIDTLLDAAITLKNARKNGVFSPVLSGKTLAMLFDKPSLRTRFSFTVGMTELGGSSVESVFATRKKEDQWTI